jgi:integrase
MARPAKVWWNKGKEAWYATIGGKKVRLADGYKNKAEAERRWHEYKAKENAPVLRHHNPIKVMAELYLDYIEAGHPSSYNSHRHYLKDLCTLFPDLSVKDVNATLVARWLHHHRDAWGEASRWSAVTILHACLNWAAKPEQNLIDANPIRGIKRGSPVSRGADTLIDPADHDAVFAACNQPVRDVLTALQQTGARPGSIRGIEAKDCDFVNGVIRLARHKTASKTGKPLIIPMTEAMRKLCERLCERWPEGPIFRTARGKPWTCGYLSEYICRAKEKLELKGRYIAYGHRHTTATDLLAAGVPDAHVAQILGHTTTQMIYLHYGHLGSRIQPLKDALERVVNGDAGKPKAAE